MLPELESYINEHSDAEPKQLRELERRVHLQLLYPRMCSGRYQGRLLKMLTAMIAPRRVLEIGTYAGYSALCIAEALTDDARLDTVEINDEMEPFIRQQFAHSPHKHKINLIIGDFANIAPSLSAGYDLVYMDANKRNYASTFETVRQLVHPGGFIFADNTLWDGKVAHPEAHLDPQTAGICEFNTLIADDSTLEKVILPIRDGLTLIRIKP